MLLTDVAVVEEVLQAHATALGPDVAGYRNHVYRVLNFCALQAGPSQSTTKMAVAAVFHDLGIWTDKTVDYLQPSIRLATAYLAQSGHQDWTAEISTTILEHHKISPYRGDSQWLVEAFRRADWIDVSRGLRTFGLSRATLAPIFSTWPNAGFHKRLIQLSLARLRTHPWSPLPMMRL